MTSMLTDNINLFQPTGFRVSIDRQNFANLQFFVQTVTHPGANNQAVETAFQRVQGVPMPGNTMTYGELSFEVLLDEDFVAYTEMYNWMLRLVNEEQVKKRDDFSGQTATAPTFADIHVTALTSHNNQNVKFKYFDCVPVNIGDIRFEANNQSVEYYTFNASFRFSHFDIVV